MTVPMTGERSLTRQHDLWYTVGKVEMYTHCLDKLTGAGTGGSSIFFPRNREVSYSMPPLTTYMKRIYET